MTGKVVLCKWCRDILPPLIEKATGVRPDAITIGGTVFYLNAAAVNSPRLAKHEAMHVTQQARYCPWWGKWLPEGTRAWLGMPRMVPLYLKEHLEYGYDGNRFEVEARRAAGE